MQKRVTVTIFGMFSFLSQNMGSIPSVRISVRFTGKQPFMAGKQVTGTVMLNNTSRKSFTFQRIYAILVGEVIYSVLDRGSYMTYNQPLYKQLINLEEKKVRR